MTKETKDPTELITQIMTAVRNPNIELRITFVCMICGRWFTRLEDCLAGLEFIPPDPFPVGTRVVERRWKRPGTVVRSDIITSETHQHRRIVEVLPDRKISRESYYIFPEEDDTTRLVLESKWETQQ